MQKALVVYESMFGNTKLIAEAIAEGLRAHLEVGFVEVSDAPRVVGPEVDLLVVGGPTHAFGMSRDGTRESAAEQSEGDLVSKGEGIREWMDTLPTISAALAAAAFDTKMRKPRLPGSASHAADKRLRKLGFTMVADPENFWVAGGEGPLVAGEQERATQWGERIGAKVSAHQHA